MAEIEFLLRGVLIMSFVTHAGPALAPILICYLIEIKDGPVMSLRQRVTWRGRADGSSGLNKVLFCAGKAFTCSGCGRYSLSSLQVT